jgi:DNA-binding MltR family transcriptional regulator
MQASIDPATSEQNREIARMLLHQQESDRGCLIFGAALLEDELELVLRAHCRKEPKIIKKVVAPLFRGYAPFSTFSAKIQASYALGLISERLYKVLDLIRKLRNDFAHEKAAVSFQSAKYQARFEAILALSDGRPAAVSRTAEPGDEEPIPHMGRTTKRQLIERLAFCLCVADCVGRLQGSRDVLLSIKKKPVKQS